MRSNEREEKIGYLVYLIQVNRYLRRTCAICILDDGGSSLFEFVIIGVAKEIKKPEPVRMDNY